MFEGMLAKKYILAQKRHSALTICSIAIALALITMLFSVFSTVMGSLRNIAYDQGAYHIQVSVLGGFTEEQYNAYAEAISGYGACTPEEEMVFGNDRYWANVMFDKYIGTDAELLAESIAKGAGIDKINCTKNDLLMLCDMVDVQSAVYMVAIVALFYVFVLFLIMMLRLIIDTAFEISSKELERQLGVLQSIGATPKQTVRIITYEGLLLSIIGIPLGVGLGIGLGYTVYLAVLNTGLADLYLSRAKAAELVHFSLNPWFLLLGVVTGAAWVLFSAYGTGMRVIKMSPVQAISQRSNTVKKVRRFSLFGLIFGWTGKIASRNNMRQPKRFVATVVSLTLSIALFSAVTVVTTNIQSGAEEYYSKEEADFTNDFCEFSIVIYTEDDRLGYRDILNKIEGSNLFGEVYSERKEYGDWVFPDGVTIEDVGYGRAYISYYNRDYYNFIFGGDPPVSYDELTESGGYILTNKVLGDHTGDSISVEMDEGYQAEISEEQYLSLTPEEQAKYTEFYVYGADETKPIKRYEFVSTVICNFDIYRKISNPTIPNNELIGTLDMYENGEYKLFESLPNHYSVGIDCNLADDDKYFEAIEFFESNGIGYFDNTAERRQMNAVLSSVNILATFFSILIALIAVVNMVNILATGILNRRGELAAMQCVGMTEKQLYKMTAVECLQYALTSGILAMGVCELLMYLTEKMLNVVIEITEKFVEYISYSQALPIIGIASLCAFIIAIAASVIPLRAMRRTSLVEQIRSVE